MSYYAHTGLLKYNILPQTYQEHITNMFKQAFVDSTILSPMLRKATLIAVIFHDFGKLDAHSQTILCQPNPVEGSHMINHVDAGVAWCLREYNKSKDISFIYAAYIIHAHHIGLQNRDTLFDIRIKNFSQIVDIKYIFRDTRFLEVIRKTVKEYFDETIDSLYAIQYSILKKENDSAMALTFDKSSVSTIEMRFALSILVDADHGDTSRHYGMPTFNSYQLRPKDRLKKLDIEVIKVQKSALKRGISQEVIDSRNVLFKECSEVDITQNNFFVCAAPTGKGKTFSLMKLALRIAKEKKREKIFFIIPFTNIISQSVKNYRKYTVLKGEDPIKIVNEIHSKVEFAHWRMRQYSHLWNSPINVSTSVQFFESLFSNRPSAVRKLKQFANSTVVFDEYHTALPQHLWKIALYTLKDMAKKYNIDFIFGSGTHVYYWDIFSDIDLNVTDVVSSKTFEEFKKFEENRITFKDIGVLIDDNHFYREFDKLAIYNDNLIGNTIIVCNTVANAVYIAKHFKDTAKYPVYHLSSYLTPIDREIILEKIHLHLKSKEKILLVATSVVECGVDFSFELGFREYGSMMSTIQFGGRVNRNKEKETAFVYEFQFNKQFFGNGTFSRHPGLTQSITARNGIAVEPDNCTNVIKNEINIKNLPDLVAGEKLQNFKFINDGFVVIENLTVSVIINKDIVNSIKNGDKVDPVIINRNSISVYRSKIDPLQNGKWVSWASKFTNNGDDVYYWVGNYDKDMYGAYACEF